jgi:Winged helix DNA-binding domain
VTAAAPVAHLTWDQVLAWRMARQYVEPLGDKPAVDIVRRLCGVQAQVASSADLAVRVRQAAPNADGVARALEDGTLLKTWAMRGTLHLLTPDLAAALLAVVASGRSWERPSWERYFGVSPAQIQELRVVVRDILAEATLTREELIAAITARPGFAQMAEALRSGWGTLLKPLAWQGDLCFGPSRGTRVTFVRPERASSGWTGLLPLEAAGPISVRAYLGAHGPATADAFGNWLAGGYFGKRQLATMFDALADELVPVQIEGQAAFALTEHFDAIRATEPSTAVRLLPGFDQYVLGPSTADGQVTAPHRRSHVSRTAGWISPVVLRGGRVCGTWEAKGASIEVSWFREAGTPPRSALKSEASRVGELLGRPGTLAITII